MRLGPRGPVGQRLEFADELVLAVAGLLERVTAELVPADPPAPGVIARRGARLHFEDEDPHLLVDDHEVRFAVPRWPAVAHRTQPFGVRVEVELLGGEGGPESLDDDSLSGLPVRFHPTSHRGHRPLAYRGHSQECGTRRERTKASADRSLSIAPAFHA